jgi:hypothetical protein
MHADTTRTTTRRSTTVVLLALTIAGAIALLVHAVPASADSRVCTPENAGCASFKHGGNTFDVCDYGFDAESVAVQRGDRKIIAVNYWGSLKFNGCRRWHVKGRNGSPFKYRVCLATHAAPGGKPIHLEPFYCSGWQGEIY